MGKKFVGLDGLKHFWTKVKTWIAGQITAEVTAKIAELVSNAPEDLDTLKEIADWISTHANDASAMNTQINTNKNDIAALQTSVAGKAAASHTHDDRYYTESEVDTKLAEKSNVEHTHTKSEITDFAHTHDDRYFTETEVTSKLAGKSDTGHTHTKSQITDFPTSLKNPNALTVNGKTYDGSSAVNAGVQTVANGGTGVTTQANINRAFIRNLEVGASDVTDGTEFVSSYASNNGFDENAEPVNTPYRRKFSTVWNYIKGKISSVLGLTKDNYGGTADKANNGFNSSTVTNSTPGWGYLTSGNGYSNGRTYSFANGGGIATAEKDTKSSLQVDGDLYVHEGLDKVATLNDIPTSLPANGGTAGTATTAAKLGRNGNTGLPMTFNWSGQGGQPSWLWGGNDGSNMYVYNPSNFSVNTANTAYKVRIGNSNPSDGDIWIQ